MNSNKYGTAVHDAGHADFGGGVRFLFCRRGLNQLVGPKQKRKNRNRNLGTIAHLQEHLFHVGEP
jgi:hypothetical protein